MKGWLANFNNLFSNYSYTRIGIPPVYAWAWFLFEKLVNLLGLLMLDRFYVLYSTYLTSSRKLNKEERRLIATVFSGTMDLDFIRIRVGKILGTMKGKVVYASINTVNSYRPIPRKILIHEIVHLWQYQKVGSSYLVRALAAQRTPKAYDYGGEEFFRNYLIDRISIRDLNYEQQASAVEDFYAQLYLNQKQFHSFSSSDLWLIDKKIKQFLLS